MRLRNKKTGEITQDNDWDFVGLVLKFDHIDGTYEMDDKIEYHSLAELNAEWEDYEEKEPLIKDPKIRKVVRAWADLYGYKLVTHRFYTTTTGHQWSLLVRETQEICLPELDGLEESKDYTITELCGEDKE